MTPKSSALSPAQEPPPQKKNKLRKKKQKDILPHKGNTGIIAFVQFFGGNIGIIVSHSSGVVESKSRKPLQSFPEDLGLRVEGVGFRFRV